ATGVNKRYDGNSSATVTLSDNRLSGDAFTDSYASASFADKNVGNGKTVSVSGFSISGTDAGNYSLSNTTASTTANITALHITGSFTADNKQYDGNATAAVLTRTPNGAIGGDSVSLTGGTAAFNDKTVANGKTVTLTGATLSGADAGNYALDSVATATANITTAPLTGTADTKTKAYGAPLPTLTATFTGFMPGDNTGNSLSGTPTCATNAVVLSPVSGNAYSITCS